MASIKTTRKSLALITVFIILIVSISVVVSYQTKSQCNSYTEIHSYKNSSSSVIQVFDPDIKCRGEYTISLREEKQDENGETYYTDVPVGKEEISAFIDSGDKTTEIIFIGSKNVIEISPGDKLTINFIREDTKQEVVLEYKD